MEEEIKNAGFHPADVNGDGKVDAEERAMYLEFKRKELEDQDAMRDAQRSMTWFALAGMLLYPATVMVTELPYISRPASLSYSSSTCMSRSLSVPAPLNRFDLAMLSARFLS